MDEAFSNDVATIGRIDAVERILEVVCRTTGMGFSAVARVTETRWIACAVRDEIAFGLKPGEELKLETTICDEIRRHGKIVAIDHVAEDPAYCDQIFHKLLQEEEQIRSLPDKYRKRIREENELMDLLRKAHRVHEERVEAGVCFVPAL